jgi:hypothetical protein
MVHTVGETAAELTETKSLAYVEGLGILGLRQSRLVMSSVVLRPCCNYYFSIC